MNSRHEVRGEHETEPIVAADSEITPFCSNAVGPALVVMRKRSLIGIVIAITASIGTLFFLSKQHPSEPPTIVVDVIGYTNQVGALAAHVKLANKGNVEASYKGVGPFPSGWVKSQSPAGWTDGTLAPSSGGTFVLRPSSCVVFDVVLPAQTLHWKCGFSVSRASIRKRAFVKLVKSSPRWYQAYGWLLMLLPSERNAECKYESGIFDSPLHSDAGAVDAGFRSTSVGDKKPGTDLLH